MVAFKLCLCLTKVHSKTRTYGNLLCSSGGMCLNVILEPVESPQTQKFNMQPTDQYLNCELYLLKS